jgi:Zincin-like metallopeptidase
MREYTVFNVDQCDNLPDRVVAGKPMRVRNPDARDELADDFLHSTGADIREGHGEAMYVPSRDFISIPAFAGFKGADHFYNVAFHELTHWSGHKSRLDRDLKNRFGSQNYAAEELVAELGAAFLCAEFGFDGDVRNAGYIGNWIELLKTDRRAFFTGIQGRGLPARPRPRRAGRKGSVMIPQAPTSNPRHAPLYEINPRTGISFEVFYTDRTLETFGRGGAGWFWWLRRRGSSPDGSSDQSPASLDQDAPLPADCRIRVPFGASNPASFPKREFANFGALRPLLLG